MNVKAAAFALLCGILAVPSARSQVIHGGITEDAVDAVIASANKQASSASDVGSNGIPKQGEAADGPRRLELITMLGTFQQLWISTTVRGISISGTASVIADDSGGVDYIAFADLELHPALYSGELDEAPNTATFTWRNIQGIGPGAYANFRYRDAKITTKQTSNGKGWEISLNNRPVDPQDFQKNKKYDSVLGETQEYFNVIGEAVAKFGAISSISVDLLNEAIVQKKNLHGPKGGPNEV